MYNFDEEEIDIIKSRVNFIKAVKLLKENNYSFEGYELGDIRSFRYDYDTPEGYTLLFLPCIFNNLSITEKYIESEEENYDADRYGYTIYGDFVGNGGDMSLTRYDLNSPIINEYLRIIKENNIKVYNSELWDITSRFEDCQSYYDYENISFCGIALDYSCIYICQQYAQDFDYYNVCSIFIEANKIMKKTISNYKKHKNTKYIDKVIFRDKHTFVSKVIKRNHIVKNKNKYVNLKKKERYKKARQRRRAS